MVPGVWRLLRGWWRRTFDVQRGIPRPGDARPAPEPPPTAPGDVGRAAADAAAGAEVWGLLCGEPTGLLPRPRSPLGEQVLRHFSLNHPDPTSFPALAVKVVD